MSFDLVSQISPQGLTGALPERLKALILEKQAEYGYSGLRQTLLELQHHRYAA